MILWWESWWVVVTCMMIYGTGLGTVQTLDMYLIVKVLGAEMLQSVMGISMLFRSATFLVLGVTLGKLLQV